jgi:hypothetical protein
MGMGGPPGAGGMDFASMMGGGGGGMGGGAPGGMVRASAQAIQLRLRN